MVDDDAGAQGDPGAPAEVRAGGRSRRSWLLGGAGLIVVVLVVVGVAVFSSRPGMTGAGADANSPAITGSAAPAGDDPSASPSDPAPADASAVPTAPVEAPPVPIDAPATALPGLAFEVTDITSVEGTATTVGEVAGPSIQFTVTATNTTADPISLETTVVNVTYGTAQTPADALSTGSAPIPPLVAAGASAAGTYIFTVPLDQRADIRISVDYQVGTPIVVFEGAGPQ